MTPIKVKTGFPTVWGDLAFQNRWLRFATMLCLGVACLSLFISVMLAERKPIVIAFDQDANIMTLDKIPPLADLVTMAAKKYISLRYSWRPANQVANLDLAKSFVAPNSLRSFDNTIADLEIYSRGKNISQRVYPTTVNVDTNKSQVELVGDRFTEIQGLKAATILRVILSYQIGPRTLANPWGIYIVKEKEVQ